MVLWNSSWFYQIFAISFIYVLHFLYYPGTDLMQSKQFLQFVSIASDIEHWNSLLVSKVDVLIGSLNWWKASTITLTHWSWTAAPTTWHFGIQLVRRTMNGNWLDHISLQWRYTSDSFVYVCRLRPISYPGVSHFIESTFIPLQIAWNIISMHFKNIS